ncbi:putative mucin TcMUCII [Trypanosoma cruzi]|nr:putative mucin TcMUCII [Trypanosoma cruzi]
MTTTCRLLCTLLVLALCCCPCAFTTAVVSEKDGPDVPRTPLKEPAPGKISSVSNIPKVSNQDIAGVSAQPVTAVAGGGSGALSTTQDKIGAPGHSLPGSGNDLPRSTDIPDNTVGKNTEHNTEESKNNGKDRVQTPNTTTTTTTTTTNTTQAPITTTSKEAPTITTTTTKAPGDTATTTEVPAVSTTRAPSLLRESDGSLSSSAWVCAPLLLAVSALAYTTVG